MKDPEYRGVY